MFDIEKSISGWRRQMLADLKTPGIVYELESHLREEIAQQMQAGKSAEEAFQAATQRVGHAHALKREFAKLGLTRWAVFRWLRGILAGVFSPNPSLATFTPSARQTLELARTEAPRLHHNFVGTEHVLLGLLALENGIVPKVLKRLGVNREALKKQVENLVGIFQSEKMSDRLPYTPRVRKSLRLAAREAKACHEACVGAEHILLGLILEGDGIGGRVLKNLGLTSKMTRDEILKEIGRSQSAC